MPSILHAHQTPPGRRRLACEHYCGHYCLSTSSTAKQTITLFTRSSDCRIFCTCQIPSIASPLSIALH